MQVDVLRHSPSRAIWNVRLFSAGRFGDKTSRCPVVEPHIVVQWTGAVDSLVSKLHELQTTPQPMSRTSDRDLATQDSLSFDCERILNSKMGKSTSASGTRSETPDMVVHI